MRFPFAMEPVVYDFAINSKRDVGGTSRWRKFSFKPRQYYAMVVPTLLKRDFTLPGATRGIEPVRRRRLLPPNWEPSCAGVCSIDCCHSSSRIRAAGESLGDDAR